MTCMWEPHHSKLNKNKSMLTLQAPQEQEDQCLRYWQNAAAARKLFQHVALVDPSLNVRLHSRSGEGQQTSVCRLDQLLFSTVAELLNKETPRGLLNRKCS